MRFAKSTPPSQNGAFLKLNCEQKNEYADRMAAIPASQNRTFLGMPKTFSIFAKTTPNRRALRRAPALSTRKSFLRFNANESTIFKKILPLLDIHHLLVEGAFQSYFLTGPASSRRNLLGYVLFSMWQWHGDSKIGCLVGD